MPSPFHDPNPTPETEIDPPELNSTLPITSAGDTEPMTRAAPEEKVVLPEAPSVPRELGPYEIQSEVGRGGMGSVYRARHKTLGAIRAVKIILRESPKRLARFQREANNLARIEHTNVVRIHDVGKTDDGQLWFAMEFLEGTPLHRLLHFERLSWERAMRMAVGLVEGVAALHEAGVIHRDLKPSNIVVTADDRAVVLDLGLAVAPELDERLTRTGTTLGTVNYMAPEQFKGAAKATARSDVFALGLLVFEMVLGEPAVDPAMNAPEIVQFLMGEDCPYPSSFDPDLPVAFDRVIRKATQRDPDRRYPDARTFAGALQEVIDEPGPTREQVRARQRKLSIAGTLVLLVLAIVLAIALPDGEAPEEDDPGEVTTEVEGPPPEWVAKGETDLERIAHLPERDRRDPLLDWQREYTGHPESDRARRMLQKVCLTRPLRILVHKSCTAARFTADGTQAITTGREGTVRLWDLTSGDELHRWRPGWVVLDVAVSRDGSMVAYAGVSNEIRVVRLPGRASEAVKRQDRGGVETLAFSRDGRYLAYGGGNPRVYVLRTRDWRRVYRFGVHRSRVRDVMFSGSGRYLVTLSGAVLDRPGNLDNSLRIWNLRGKGELVTRHPLLAMPHAGAFAGDGRRFAVACDGRRVVLFNVERGVGIGELRGEHPGSATLTRGAHAGIVQDVAYGPAARRIYSVSNTRSELRAWDATNKKQLHRIASYPDSEYLEGVDVAPDGQRVLVRVRGGRVELWDLSGLE